MTEPGSANPIAQRLGVERLTSPGVVSRAAIERTYDRYMAPAGAHVFAALQRRVAPGSASGASLPLARGYRAVAADDSSTTPAQVTSEHPVVSDTRARATVLARTAASPDAPSFAPHASAPETNAARATRGTIAARLVARRSPGVSRLAETIARRVDASMPAAASHSMLDRAAAASVDSAPRLSPTMPAVVTNTTWPVVIQRSPEQEHVAPRASATPIERMPEDPTATSTTSLPVVATPVSGSDTSRSERINQVARVAPSAMPIARAHEVATLGAAPTMVLRKALGTAPTISSARATAVASTMPPGIASPSALLLRKADPLSSSSTAAATTSHMPPGPASAQQTVPGTVGVAGGTLNIDWIAEQVGSRLARRLEIERERMGVRSWRQVS